MSIVSGYLSVLCAYLWQIGVYRLFFLQINRFKDIGNTGRRSYQIIRCIVTVNAWMGVLLIKSGVKYLKLIIKISRHGAVWYGW